MRCSLTVRGWSLISNGRTAALEDLVLRTDTKLASLVPETILGMVFDLTNRYSSPRCFFFLNVPHNMFATLLRLSFAKSCQIAPGAIQSRLKMYPNSRSPKFQTPVTFLDPIDHSRIHTQRPLHQSLRKSLTVFFSLERARPCFKQCSRKFYDNDLLTCYNFSKSFSHQVS